MTNHIVGSLEVDYFLAKLYDNGQCAQCAEQEEHRAHLWEREDHPERKGNQLSTTYWWCEGWYPVWPPEDVDEFLNEE